MDDATANKIVFGIFIFIVIGIIITVNQIARVSVYSAFISRLQNNSGNWSATKILLMFFALSGLLFILYWLFRPKTTQKSSRNVAF